MDQPIAQFEDEAVIIAIGVAVGQGRAHGLLDDDPIAVAVETVALDRHLAHEQPRETSAIKRVIASVPIR
nr:hypothetical protein [Nocardia pseudobrasiliensis]